MHRLSGEGATLLELLVVLTIVAVIGAVTVPMALGPLSSADRPPREDTILDRANSAAMREADDIVVTLEAGSRRYRMAIGGAGIVAEEGPYGPSAGEANRTLVVWRVSRFGTRARVEADRPTVTVGASTASPRIVDR